MCVGFITARVTELWIPPRVCVVSAGTSDLAVAEEAALTATVMGHQVDRLYDVGVAGLHRLLASMDRLQKLAIN